MTARLRVLGLSHTYGITPVLHGIELDVPAGATMAVLGPSGCGKSTLLRLVAGFERPLAGSVEIGGRLVADGRRWVPPEQRGIGFVTQDGSLFPHLTVRRNIEFGIGRDRDRVLDLLALVSLSARHLDRYPHELSGGQQQRVALARTLARRPGLVLLDEPFSALDTDLRAATRAAVAEALRHAGVTTLLVTHDHGEALSFAEYLAVMVDGRLRQVGSPHEVYQSPVDLDTARLVGGVVTLPGTAAGGVAQTAIGPVVLRGGPADGEVRVMLRPEQLTVEPRLDGTGQVVTAAYFGHDRLVEIAVAGKSVRARVPGSIHCTAGDPVEVRVEGSGLAFPADPGTSRAVADRASP